MRCISKRRGFFVLFARIHCLISRCIILFLCVLLVAVSTFYLLSHVSRTRNAWLHQYCDKEYRDNIGYSSYASVLCFPQIDAVYTWVNGSDPIWHAEMQYYKNKHRKQLSLAENETDSSSSQNRFRDNDELRYSLRSLDINDSPHLHCHERAGSVVARYVKPARIRCYARGDLQGQGRLAHLLLSGDRAESSPHRGPQ